MSQPTPTYHNLPNNSLIFQGVILLDANGESCDGEEEVEGERRGLGGLDVVWVGAEVKTGKSSIRSKQKTKKVS